MNPTNVSNQFCSANDELGSLNGFAPPPAVLGMILLLILIANSLYILMCFMSWRDEFMHRPEPGSADAPSFQPRPRVKSVNYAKLATFRPSLFDVTTGNATPSAALAKGIAEASARKPSSRTPFSNIRITSLDMDHLRVSFSMYLFAMYFIGPSAMLLWINGVFKLMFREFLYKKGFVKPQPHNPSETVAKLLLNSMEAVHYIGMKNRVATFVFDNLPMLDMEANVAHAASFSVDIDLDEMKMVKANLDGTMVSAVDAMVLIWFATISSDHVKIHSLANWAAAYSGGEIKNHFQDRMSQISVIYNFFGFRVFAKLCYFWYAIGWSSCNLSGILGVFESGCEEGIPRHSQMTELSKDSEVVDFIAKLVFLHFQKVQARIPASR
jgi:hypothetical protein